MFLLNILEGAVNWIIRLLTFSNEYCQILSKTNHNNSIVHEKKKNLQEKKNLKSHAHKK